MWAAKALRTCPRNFCVPVNNQQIREFFCKITVLFRWLHYCFGLPTGKWCQFSQATFWPKSNDRGVRRLTDSAPVLELLLAVFVFESATRTEKKTGRCGRDEFQRKTCAASSFGEKPTGSFLCFPHESALCGFAPSLFQFGYGFIVSKFVAISAKHALSFICPNSANLLPSNFQFESRNWVFEMLTHQTWIFVIFCCGGTLRQ